MLIKEEYESSSERERKLRKRKLPLNFINKVKPAVAGEKKRLRILAFWCIQSARWVVCWVVLSRRFIWPVERRARRLRFRRPNVLGQNSSEWELLTESLWLRVFDFELRTESLWLRTPPAVPLVNWLMAYVSKSGCLSTQTKLSEVLLVRFSNYPVSFSPPSSSNWSFIKTENRLQFMVWAVRFSSPNRIPRAKRLPQRIMLRIDTNIP